MSIRYLLFVGICLGIARDVYTEDLTLKSGETSNAAVEATIRKIRTKCVLAQDYYFLRRLAEAQMNSTSATTGGIWRVNSTQLATVQNACNGTLKANCSTIQTELNVDVSTLTMSDLQKPLYSGLVMSLFILNLNSPIPLNKQLQADYWIQHINPAGLENDFVDSANKVEQKNECISPQIDLVFVIDSSSSIKLPIFEEVKSFLNDVVSKLDIRPEKTQVSVIRVASTVSTVFGLGTNSTKTAVRNAISNITYTGWSSATNYALDEARTNVFTNARKSVAAKVLVLVTDGRSDNNVKTVEAARKLKDDGVIIFTIGVDNLTEDELRAVASEPSCTHFIHLKDYNETDFIVRDIQSESCRAAIRIEKNTQLLNIAIPQTNETEQIFLEVNYTAKSTLATQVLVTVQCGVVTVYASFSNSYPNKDDYDKTSTTDDKPGKLFLERKLHADKLFLTVLSQKRFDLKSSACDNPFYDISINPTAPRTEAACVVKEVNSSCTAKQLDSACYDMTPVVGEVSQLYNNSVLKNGQIQEQVLDISNSTDSSGSTIRTPHVKWFAIESKMKDRVPLQNPSLNALKVSMYKCLTFKTPF
uniref:VWFA domain-containing protein n=1 Tax=Octopus bimaculoides TaxID=37653 RepID=A0A0L8HKA6_OCTBM